MKGLLLRSLEEHMLLEMIYMSTNNQISQRRILVTDMNDSTIRAYCYLRKQTRLFKIENILSIMPQSFYGQKLG